MSKWTNHNFKTFGFFLLLAFMFLVVTKLSKKYTETLQFKVELINTPDDLYFNQDSLPHISATVNTLGFNYLASVVSRNVIKLDFKSFFSLEQNYMYCSTANLKSLIASKVGSNAVVEIIKPDTISVPYAKLISKTIPVKLKSDLKFAQGYQLFKPITINPSSVTIVGALNQVSEIEEIETIVLSKKDVAKSFTQSVDLINPNNSVVKINPKQVGIEVVVEKYTENVVSVPIDFIGLPNNVKVNYFPKRVDVYYEVSLSDAQRVVPELFEVICDYNSIALNNVAVVTPILYKQPEFVRNARLKLKEVEFIIIE